VINDREGEKANFPCFPAPTADFGRVDPFFVYFVFFIPILVACTWRVRKGVVGRQRTSLHDSTLMINDRGGEKADFPCFPAPTADLGRADYFFRFFVFFNLNSGGMHLEGS
jgi:hypothetical protein